MRTPAKAFPASMTAFSPYADSLTPVSVGPFGDIGDGAYVPLQDIDNTFQYAGTLSWTTFTASADNLRTQDVRLRLNYLFNSGPVVARY